jgi:CDP-diacylglycerol--serine O-phosphatidyltransferase
MLDGWIARSTKTSSIFGIQLDSLADVVSFGVVPAFLVLKLVSLSAVNYLPNRIIWVVCGLYLSFVALRLARFNVEATTKKDDHQYFSGLPTPGAAAVVASLSILYKETNHKIIIHAMPFLILLLSILMISRIRYVHFSGKFLKAKPFIKLVEIMIFLFLIVHYLEITLSAVFLIYVLSGIMNHFRQRIFKPKTVSSIEARGFKPSAEGR